MRTLGIDLASKPTDTAVAGIDWDHGDGPRLVPFAEIEVETFTDDRLISFLDSGEWGRIAIDVPFGWPSPLLDVLNGWRAGEPVELPEEKRSGRSETIFRGTDLIVWERAETRPTPVGLDKLAWVALRALHILSASGAHRDRAGLRSTVIETYPKAALRCYRDMPVTSTKSGEDASRVRGEVLDRIATELELRIHPDDRQHLIAPRQDHRFDALICALIARAAMLGQTTLPRPGRERHLAEEEGWIHLPKEGSSLERLAAPIYEPVEMPDRFALETFELDGEWLLWGEYESKLFDRLPDGSYLCVGHGGSPTWIRCVHREDHLLHVIDGSGAPSIHRLRSIGVRAAP